MNTCTDCQATATQIVTTFVENADVAGYLDFALYCDTHATAVSDELAHGEPPNVELVCIIPITVTGTAQRIGRTHIGTVAWRGEPGWPAERLTDGTIIFLAGDDWQAADHRTAATFKAIEESR